jgi:hypothetical protein
MGRFKALSGAETVREQSGMFEGQPTTVRLWRRELGSTAGVLFVTVLCGDGLGTTEQFSGERRKLAYRAYLGAVEQLRPFDLETPVEAPAASAPAAPLTAGQKAAQTRKLRAQGLAPAVAPRPALSAAERSERQREAGRKAAETRRANIAARNA